jgi:hypothetical protein
MKKMTCREMGGACDAEIHGETSEEMMKNGKNHVHEVNDEAHNKIVKQMENSSPEEIQAWEKDFKEKYQAAPDA